MLLQFTLVVKCAEEVGCKLMVDVRCSTTIYVERDAEFLERLLYHLMIAVNDLLHRYSLFPCTYGNRHTMLVGTTYEYHILLLQSQISHIYVCRHIYSCQVSYMDTTVSIRQGCRHCSAFKILILHCNIEIL